MNYRPEIDGLRAIAVIPVLLYHAGFSWFSGGYVGVDVFFVISGYLITTILIGEIQAGNFSIWRFYERRARRILPALCFVMLACIPFAWKWMLPDQFKDFGQSMLAVVFFASNILFWRESGYFEASAEEKPLLHTWSLAVEEQYYLLFPLFLLFAFRYGKQRVFWMICIVACHQLCHVRMGLAQSTQCEFLSVAFADLGTCWRDQWRPSSSPAVAYAPTGSMQSAVGWRSFMGSLCSITKRHSPASIHAVSGRRLSCHHSVRPRRHIGSQGCSAPDL